MNIVFSSKLTTIKKLPLFFHCLSSTSSYPAGKHTVINRAMFSTSACFDFTGDRSLNNISDKSSIQQKVPGEQRLPGGKKSRNLENKLSTRWGKSGKGFSVGESFGRRLGGIWGHGACDRGVLPGDVGEEIMDEPSQRGALFWA